MTLRAAGLALAALVWAGCLPSSQRQNSREVSAADSVSALVASRAPVDTLAVVWTAEAPASDPMPLPTSLGWLTPSTSRFGDRLAVVETQEGSLRLFSEAGAYVGRTGLGGEGVFPYLAGSRGDSVVVLARGRNELLWAVPGRGVVRREPAPAGATSALATDSLLAVRLGGGATEAPAEITLLDESGRVQSRHPVTGPAWRAAGFLREWGGRPVALSGYRPVVDVLDAGAADGAPLDTLALHGFGSPQLVRSAQFMRGEVDEPPLLTSSAAALGDRLFVLNLRADHVRVDVYDRAGRLQRALVSPGPWAPTDVVPLDVAVRPGPGGAVDLAVLLARPPGVLQGPASRVVLYRWSSASAVPA